MFDQDEKLITKTPYLRLFALTQSSLPRWHRQPVILSSTGTLPRWPGLGTCKGRAVTRPETDDFALEEQFLVEASDVKGVDVKLSPERANIRTAEEPEFLSDPIVALSVRIVMATLSS